MVDRLKIGTRICAAILDENELSEFDVNMVEELVFALTWSPELQAYAKQHMLEIIGMNNLERVNFQAELDEQSKQEKKHE